MPVIAVARFALPARRELLPVTAWRISNTDSAHNHRKLKSRAENAGVGAEKPPPATAQS
jgi:hypothetical protein